MAIVTQNYRVTQPQKRSKQKQKKKQQKRRKQQRRNRNQGGNAAFPSDAFLPKTLKQLCQGKSPLPIKGNKNTVFAQRCILTTQDGQQQQCFLSNYMTQQATVGSSDVSPAIVWSCKPPVARWPGTVYPQQQSTFANYLWQDGQQSCVLNSVVPPAAFVGRMGSNLCTLTSKDLQYEANEIMPRPMIPGMFANNPSMSPY